MNHGAFVRTRVGSKVKILGVLGALALLLIPTYVLVIQDIALVKSKQAPLAAILVEACCERVLIAVGGDGVLHPLDDPTEEQITGLGKLVGPHSKIELQVPCMEAAPSQQTYLHQ